MVLIDRAQLENKWYIFTMKNGISGEFLPCKMGISGIVLHKKHGISGKTLAYINYFL